MITAITAQNTQGVSAVFPLPLAVVEQQLDAVFSDIPVLAVKIGMLADAQSSLWLLRNYANINRNGLCSTQ